VTLANGQKIYTAEYKARNGAPTVVLLHGLTYTMKPWQAMVNNFGQSDLGVLVYDMRGMGKTLEATGPAKDVIPLEKQVEDLDYLLRDRGLDRVTLAGLSYGGAVAIAYAQAHPERVANLVLMAPFVKALKQQDDMIKQRIQMFRMMNPRDKRSDDELYETFLRDIIFQTYPLYEPVVKEHPWRLEAVYQMVRGVRKFLGAEAVKTVAAIPVHLLVAGKDQYVPVQDLNEFWSALRPDQKGSRITIRGSEHKMPEAVPNFVSAWITHIVASDASISGGREFDGNPSQGTAVARDAKVEGLGIDKVRPFGFAH
jgi:pimeloyl-ACP methyl ester carboxylesterase